MRRPKKSGAQIAIRTSKHSVRFITFDEYKKLHKTHGCIPPLPLNSYVCIDIWRMIVEYLHWKDLIKLSGINRDMHELILTSRAWENNYRYYFRVPDDLPTYQYFSEFKYMVNLMNRSVRLVSDGLYEIILPIGDEQSEGRVFKVITKTVALLREAITFKCMTSTTGNYRMLYHWHRQIDMYQMLEAFENFASGAACEGEVLWYHNIFDNGNFCVLLYNHGHVDLDKKEAVLYVGIRDHYFYPFCWC